MKSLRLLTVFIVLLFLFSVIEVYCTEDYLEYRVQINSDRSASWNIMLVSDVNATVDTWEGFQERIFMFMEAAVNLTNRPMAIDPETIYMETVISWETQSKTTEYRFKWLNFSISEGDYLIFGDIFEMQSFFDLLYGNGILQISYPVGYSVSEVSPSPDEQDGDSQTMVWFRTQDFVNGNPRGVLVSRSSLIVGGKWIPYFVLGLVLTVVVLASLGGFLLVWRRRSKIASSKKVSVGEFFLESDEEKVTRFLVSSGGSVYQSSIGEQFGFSKAKTSQLLSSLEKKGVLARYKRGRDKIVTLIERTAGDKS